MFRKAAILVAAAAAFGFMPKTAHAQATFTCESYSGRLQVCRANTREGVWLVRQLSDVRCVKGRTWGSNPDEVWVKDGCRGEFQTAPINNRTSRRYSRGNSRYNNNNNGRYNRTPATGRAVRNGVARCQQAAASRMGVRRAAIQSWLSNDGRSYSRYEWRGGGRSGYCYFDANGNLTIR